MKRLSPHLWVVIIVAFLTAAVTYGLAYHYVLSKYIEIEAGRTVNKDLKLEEGQIVLGDDSVVNGDLHINDGEILIGKRVRVHGDIEVGHGDLSIDDESRVDGSITVKNGQVHLGAGAQIEGDLRLDSGDFEKHSTAVIKGVKPDIFATYDWPPVIKYFDVLPENHKKALGYVLITKENNVLVRDPAVVKATDYFEGIYFYKDGKLVSVDLSDEAVVKPFFEKAKALFTKLPEANLPAFGVGATTLDFAMNPEKADIFIPSTGSSSIFIHEMGHVMDFQEDFSDFKVPKYPFLGKDMAVSGYGGTHPGEDFAEAYKYYVLSHEYFYELIEEMPERQEKYNYLRDHVFEGREFES